MSGHHHHGEENHPPLDHTRAFVVGIVLNVLVVLVQVVMGVYAGSLALMADAGHNLSDVLGLMLAWGGVLLARRQPTPRHTYGLRRSTILAALANSILILLAVGAIAWEAIRRFNHPEPVEGGIVMAVAGFGIAINALTAWLFMSGRKKDINLEGAFLHMAGDAAISLGVVIGGALMIWTGYAWIDPVLSLAIAFLIAWSTWSLLKKSLNLAMDAVPAHINPHEVRAYLDQLPGVMEVHDLHIWPMSTTEAALTAHLVMPEGLPNDAFWHHANHGLAERFDIRHSTIQVERGDSEHPCHLAPDTHV